MEKLTGPIIQGRAVSSRPSIDESQRQRSRKSLIEQCQRIIFSAYRADQYADPEGYIDSLNLVFGQYPSDVVKWVSDPRTGVQRGCEWPPSIAKIVAACDKRMSDVARLARLQNWGKQEAPLLEAPREERPTLAELKAKFGENYGLAPAEPRKPPAKAPSWDQIIARYQADPSRIARLTKADEA